jgi:8-oxo-dGTP pyrophosphatase MutT (NUDIX family)
MTPVRFPDLFSGGEEGIWEVGYNGNGSFESDFGKSLLIPYSALCVCGMKKAVPDSSEIECLTLSGQVRRFPKERLILRPAAYALIVHARKILLLKMRATGKYHLPGGGIEPGERIEETLRREVREEIGIELGAIRFLHFEEAFFYYDPSDRAYHGLHFYYACTPVTFELLPDEQVNDGSAGQPRWVEIAGLRPEAFQLRGESVLELCNQMRSDLE